MLSPDSHDFVCRKKRILATPDHICHQAPRSVEFLAIRSSFAVSTALYRLTLTAPLNQKPGSVEILIYRNTYDVHNFLPFSWKMMLKSSDQQKRSSLKHHCSVPNEPPRSNACRPPRNGQPRRRPEHPPGSNTRVCLNFVSTTFLCQKLQMVAYVWIAVVVLLYLPVFFISQRIQERSGGSNRVLIIVEARPAGSRLPAADDSMLTSKGGKYGFGASAPSLTRASLMNFSGARRSSAILSKLVELVGPSSTRAEGVSPRLARSSAVLSVRLRFLVSVLHLPPWRDVGTQLDIAVLLDAGNSCSSLPCL